MKKIIIADDSALARMFIRRCLEIAGLCDSEFRDACDGLDALRQMKENPPDLLVTDLTMPNMNGIELLRQISACPEFSGLPVLVVTSAGNEEQRKQLYELGAAKILSKPLSPPMLVEAIDEIFGITQTF
jgi:Response regulator containing a CheY-like receiver domain and an HTH DNA-binding domain